MILDLLVLIAIALLTYLGYIKGFARQIVGVGAIIAVYFLAAPCATLIRTVVFSSNEVTYPGTEVASLAIAAVVVFVVVWLIGRTFIATLTTISERIEDLDMLLGGVLGFIKGALIVYLVLCGLVYAEAPLGSAVPPLGQQIEQSFTVGGARRVNIITLMRYPGIGDLRSATMAAQDPEKAERNEALQRLLKNENFREVVQDEDLVRAAEERDYSTLLSDARVLELLADDDFRTVLQETDWDALDE